MKVNATYAPYLQDYTHKYEIYYGGGGSGKSYFVAQKLILKAYTMENRKILVLRKTGVTLKRSVIQLYMDILNEEGLSYEWRATEFKIIFPNGSTIMFGNMGEPERIKSIICTDIDLEEATEFTIDDFLQLCTRLRPMVPFPQFILQFNPIHKLNYCYRLFFDKGGPEYFLDGKSHLVIKTTYKDNITNLPQDYIDLLESYKFSQPYYYKVYCLGEFATLGKLVFEPGTYTIKAMQIPLGCKHIWGADPGTTDKFAICGSAYIKETNTLYTYKELCQSEILNKDVAAWAKANIPSGCTVYTDNAGKSQVQELNALGLYNFVSNSKPPGSVISTIDRLHTFNWVINPSCVNLIKDLQMYQYEKDKKTGLYLNEPAREVDGYHCDAIDAVRYSLEGIGNTAIMTKIKGYRGI